METVCCFEDTEHEKVIWFLCCQLKSVFNRSGVLTVSFCSTSGDYKIIKLDYWWSVETRAVFTESQTEPEPHYLFICFYNWWWITSNLFSVSVMSMLVIHINSNWINVILCLLIFHLYVNYFQIPKGANCCFHHHICVFTSQTIHMTWNNEIAFNR